MPRIFRSGVTCNDYGGRIAIFTEDGTLRMSRAAGKRLVKLLLDSGEEVCELWADKRSGIDRRVKRGRRV